MPATGAVCPVGRLVGPADTLQPFTQVAQDDVGDVQSERLHAAHAGSDTRVS